jgi:hypothetical protein
LERFDLPYEFRRLRAIAERERSLDGLDERSLKSYRKQPLVARFGPCEIAMHWKNGAIGLFEEFKAEDAFERIGADVTRWQFASNTGPRRPLRPGPCARDQAQAARAILCRRAARTVCGHADPTTSGMRSCGSSPWFSSK